MEFSSDNNVNDANKIPLKLGVRCQPPAVTLLYKEGEKNRFRIMPIHFLNKFGPVDIIIQEIRERHTEYLKAIPDIKLEKMLRILQETQKGCPIEKACGLICKEYMVDPEQNLNKLSDSELSKKKKIMENNFLKNQVKQSDPNYQYDIQVDFKSPNKVDSGWDSDEDTFWAGVK